MNCIFSAYKTYISLTIINIEHVLNGVLTIIDLSDYPCLWKGERIEEYDGNKPLETYRHGK